MRGLILILLSAAFCFPLNSSAAPLKACLKTETGKVVIKRRCKAVKGFEEINAEVLQGLGATQVGPQGPAGPIGAKGNTGPQGDQGIPGDAGFELHANSEIQVLITGAVGTAIVSCPDNMSVATYRCEIDTAGLTLFTNTGISLDANKVTCRFQNTSGSGQSVVITAKAYCVAL